MDEKEDLLVFGYSCKLFRDDEKANFVDQGKHLIPWMGNQNLMIDRYDVRGALYDLKEAESKGEENVCTTELEVKLEELCEHERYFALYHDEAQVQALEEEEMKRLEQEMSADLGNNYGQVAFSYGGENNVGQQQQQSTEFQEQVDPAEQEQFTPPSSLEVPPDMIVPSTMKQNKIIEKTAKFIVTQGAQMEIIIKAKQADNPMFSFLAFDNLLNPYYKHMVIMVRNGRYKIEKEEEKPEQKPSDQYLHPKLLAGIKPDLTPGNVTTPQKADKDCAYSKLVHKIKVKREAEAQKLQESQASQLLKEKEKEKIEETEREDSPALLPSRGSSPSSSDRSSTPKPEPKLPKKKIKGLVDYPSFNRTRDETDTDTSSSSSEEELQHDWSIDLKKSSNKTSTPAAVDYSNIKWPPPDIQMVIDKMASYIIKNGPQFESVVRSRGDKRFNFMKKKHQYYPYYQCKIQLYQEVYGNLFNKTNNKERNGSLNDREDSTSSSNAKKHKKPTAIPTISFSIRSKEQENNLERNSTFPLESSSTDDEEMEEEERERRRKAREERREQRKRKAKEDKERKDKEERIKRQKLEEHYATKKLKEKEREKEKEKVKGKEKVQIKQNKQSDSEKQESSGPDEDIYDIFKYAQEMGSNSTEETSNQEATTANSIDFKRVERKKKAAEFLSKLKNHKDLPTNIIGPQLPPTLSDKTHYSGPKSASSDSRESTASPNPFDVPCKSEYDSDKDKEKENEDKISEIPSLKTSLHSRSTSPIGMKDLLNSKAYKLDGKIVPEPPPISSLSNWNQLKKEHKKSIVQSESSLEEGAIVDDSDNSEENDIPKSKTVHSRKHKSRSKKKHTRERSSSLSPSVKKEKKKRKHSKSSSSKKRKRNRSRSRSRSRTRSKSYAHRSHKRKHKHHKEQKKKKSKRYRSPSESSSSSQDSSSSSSDERSPPPNKKSRPKSNTNTNSNSSDSEPDIQIVEPPSARSIRSSSRSRASSIVSVVHSEQASVSDKTEEISNLPLFKTAATTPLLLASSSKSSSPAPFSNNESSSTAKDLKPLFNAQTSSAVAKITQGLRAKVHALLEK